MPANGARHPKTVKQGDRPRRRQRGLHGGHRAEGQGCPDLRRRWSSARKDIGIIGVGEGSTVAAHPLPPPLPQRRPEEVLRGRPARPGSWACKFLWGPRPYFYYTFGPGPGRQARRRCPGRIGFYCDDDDGVNHCDAALGPDDATTASSPAAPAAGPRSTPTSPTTSRTRSSSRFLEGYAVAARRGDRRRHGRWRCSRTTAASPGLVLKSGRTETADLYVDCSGFASVLLGKALGEPFVSFKAQPVLRPRRRRRVGPRGPDEPIKPYTTCETMDAGWAGRSSTSTASTAATSTPPPSSATRRPSASSARRTRRSARRGS